ncbi:MAG: hypothetical protein ABIJ42_10130 [Acidobacteriota bacterium]
MVFLITGIIAVSLFCGCIWGMLLFLVLKGANKYIIPLFAIIILSLFAVIVMREFTWMPDFLTTLPSRSAALALITPVSALLGWWFPCKYFESRDSSRLVD